MEGIIKKIGEKIEKIIVQKDEIEKMDQNLLKYQEEILEKNKEAEQIKEKESGFYKDIKEQMDEKRKLHAELFDIRQREKNKLNDEISKFKIKIIEELKEKQKIIDENRNKNLENINIEELKNEKKKIEEEIKLNDVTKEEFLKMDSEEQKRVRKAKEKYLINKKRLAEITPDINLINLLDGKEPKERFLEISGIVEQVNNNFNLEHIEELKFLLINEREEQEQEWTEKNDDEINHDEQEQECTEKNDDKINYDEQELPEIDLEGVFEPEQKPNKISTENVKRENSLNENKKSERNIKISEIWIDEKINQLSFSVKDLNKGENQKPIEIKKIEKIEDVLKNKKEIFKINEISKICTEVTGSRLKGWFLKRKINPIVIHLMDYIKDKESIKKYLECLYTGSKLDFEMSHDLRNSSLSFRNKMLMSRCAKVEETLDVEVIRDENKFKFNLLSGNNNLKVLGEKTKRKIKNAPKKFMEGSKHFSKSIRKNLYKATNSLVERLKVDDEVMENLDNVSRESQDYVVSKLEDRDR